MRHFISSALYLIMCLSFAGCEDSSAILPSKVAQAETSNVTQGLPPLSPKFYEFAVGGTQLFFLEGRDAIKDHFHPSLQGVSDNRWTFLKGVASETADLRAIEYYGHAYGEHDGFHFVVVQLKVPIENGYNLVKVIMPSNEPCCRLAGLDINSHEDLSLNTEYQGSSSSEILTLRY